MNSKKHSLNIDVFIPVRLDSSRLPGKALKKINNLPILKILVDRLSLSKNIRHIVVCTTTSKSDDLIEKYCKKQKIMCHRGNKKDILKRFLIIAKKLKTDIIIDVEGDKLYTDPFFVDLIAEEMIKGKYDFVIGNDSKTIFNPKNHLIHGFIPAGFSFDALIKICKLKKSKNTETGYKEFFLIPKLFKTYFFVPKFKSSLAKNIRLTIDYHEDIILAKKIFSLLNIKSNHKKILALFESHPELIDITLNSNKIWQNNYDKNITDFSLY